MGLEMRFRTKTEFRIGTKIKIIVKLNKLLLLCNYTNITKTKNDNHHLRIIISRHIKSEQMVFLSKLHKI